MVLAVPVSIIGYASVSERAAQFVVSLTSHAALSAARKAQQSGRPHRLAVATDAADLKVGGHFVSRSVQAFCSTEYTLQEN